MSTSTVLIAGIIIECIVLALLTIFKKWSGKVFALVAAVTAICCLAVGILNAGTQRVEKQTDIRSSVYMAARLIEEDHPMESLELLSGISDQKTEQYGTRPLRALAYNLNGAFLAAESVLKDGENSETEQQLLNLALQQSAAGDDLKKSVVQDVFSLVAATDKEAAAWETEMGVRFMDLDLTDEEKQAENSRLALAKDAINDYRTEEAFRIMTENTSSVKDAIIVSEMYARGYSNRIMSETDEEYALLWKETTELQAELNVASLSFNETEEMYDADSGEESEEAAQAREEYERLEARYRIALSALNEEAAKRSINYLEEYGTGDGREAAGVKLQEALLYFDLREHDKARECLDEVFFNDALTGEDWLGTDIIAFKRAFILNLSNSKNKEYEVLLDNIMASLYQGLFGNSGEGDFKEFIEEYMKEKLSGLSIMQVNTDEFPRITADVSVTNDDIVLDKENVVLTDSGSEIKEFTIEQIEVKDLSIVFVLDKSGSMSGENIDASKEAIKGCIAQVEEGVQMGLVTFESSATQECMLTTNGSAISSIVGGIEAQGGTDVAAGLAMGVEMLSTQSGTKVIILLSDGSGGDSGPEMDTVLAEAFNKGIVIYTIGLRGSNENSLMNIAGSTGGQYIMVEDTAQLASTYSDLQHAVTNSYKITYEVADDSEYRRLDIKENGSGREASKIYSTIKEETPVTEQAPENETESTQSSDFYKQTGGSE